MKRIRVLASLMVVAMCAVSAVGQTRVSTIKEIKSLGANESFVFDGELNVMFYTYQSIGVMDAEQNRCDIYCPDATLSRGDIISHFEGTSIGFEDSEPMACSVNGSSIAVSDKKADLPLQVVTSLSELQQAVYHGDPFVFKGELAVAYDIDSYIGVMNDGVTSLLARCAASLGKISAGQQIVYFEGATFPDGYVGDGLGCWVYQVNESSIKFADTTVEVSPMEVDEEQAFDQLYGVYAKYKNVSVELISEGLFELKLPNGSKATSKSSLAPGEYLYMEGVALLMPSQGHGEFILLGNAPKAGVEGVGVDAAEGAVEWFNLQGQSVSEPRNGGLFIRRQGHSVEKVIVK